MHSSAERASRERSRDVSTYVFIINRKGEVIMKFIPRLTAPAKDDKRFIHYSKGGYNTCIMIDKNTGSVLPNCVGYAQGRLLEILGAKAPNWKLPACNAEDWIETAQKNGFKTGMTPKLGAITVFRAGATHNGSDGAGHVVVVEEIKANGDIVVSQSAYGGSEWYLSTLTKASGYIYSANRPLEGFVYCGIEFEQPTPTPTPSEDLNKNTIPNRFKVLNKDGKQIGAYTNYSLACNFAKSVGAIVIDSANNNKQVYPEEVIKSELTATSYPDYTGNDYYRVRKSFADSGSSKGSFQKWKNAFNTWNANKASGYHVYDYDGNQLD